LSYEKVMITNNFRLRLFQHNININKRKYKRTQMAHLLSLVSNEKVKRSYTYVNKLVSELVTGCYFYLRS